ncbi:MAG: ribose 5-phosphate isomerase B [Clostridia bacterium]|nr:ribose 5-phosphate isomerase B [Clostridia bacterium]
MNIIFASDHAGYRMKLELIPFVEDMGHTVFDIGCHDESSMDYPDVAYPFAEAIGKGEYDRGIVICGTGIGVSMCANRVKGVRCAHCADPLSARLTRQHNDANAIALGGRIIGIELAKEIVKEFLTTDFAGGRHQRRVDKIENR